PMQALYIGGMGAQGRNLYNHPGVRDGDEAEAAAIQDAPPDGRKEEAAAPGPPPPVGKTPLSRARSPAAERGGGFRESGVSALNVAPIAPTHAERVRLIEQIRDIAA